MAKDQAMFEGEQYPVAASSAKLLYTQGPTYMAALARLRKTPSQLRPLA